MVKTKDVEDFIRYEEVKERCEGVSKAKHVAYDNLFDRLGLKEGENEIYKQPKLEQGKLKILMKLDVLKVRIMRYQ